MTESPSGLMQCLKESSVEYLQNYVFDETLRTHPRSIAFVRHSTERLVAMIDGALELFSEAQEPSGAPGAQTSAAATKFAILALEVIDLGVGLKAWARAARSEQWIASVWVDPGSSPIGMIPVQSREEFDAAVEEWFAELPLIAHVLPWLEATAESEPGEGRRPTSTELASFIEWLTLGALDEVAPIMITLGTKMTEVEWARFYNADDKPRTDAEIKAWDRAHHDLWFESGRQYRRAPGRSIVTGNGYWAARVGATVGSDAKEHTQAVLSSDPRIFGIKRGARIREFYQPRSPELDYSGAFSPEDFKRIYDAVAFANRRGIVLNARITIAWFMLEDSSQQECAKHFERFKKNLVQWYRDNASVSASTLGHAYVYVHEAAAGLKHHSHMRLAVPPDLRGKFGKEVHQALRKVVGPHGWPEPKRGKGGKLSEFVKTRVNSVPNYDPKRRWPVTRDQWIGIMYMLKGVDPRQDFTKRPSGQTVTFGDLLEWSYENPGTKWTGRRADASENLKQKAQTTFFDGNGDRFLSLLAWQQRKGKADVRDLFSDFYLDQAHGRPAKGINSYVSDAEEALSSIRTFDLTELKL